MANILCPAYSNTNQPAANPHSTVSIQMKYAHAAGYRDTTVLEGADTPHFDAVKTLLTNISNVLYGLSNPRAQALASITLTLNLHFMNAGSSADVTLHRITHHNTAGAALAQLQQYQQQRFTRECPAHPRMALG